MSMQCMDQHGAFISGWFSPYLEDLWKASMYEAHLSVRYLFLNHITLGDLDGAKEALSKMKYYVTNSEMLHPLLPDD